MKETLEKAVPHGGRWRRYSGMAWRVSKVGFGFLLLIGGAVLAVPGIPGPGLLLIFLGLVLLSAEFLWARRLRKKVQGQVNKVVPRKWRARLTR